ncbi:RNA polymerase subunit alpha [Alphaproteobacteria bacterium]
MEKIRNLLPKNWLALIRPAEYFLTNLSGNVATFRVEPLERGFGITLGNALRRIMLSSLQGVAVTGVQIEGVDHEYSTVEGVKEDVVDIILNLKSVVIRADIIEKQVVTLKAKGPCVVTAGHIETINDVEIVNPDAVICHLDKGAELSMRLYISSGKGYIPAEHHKTQEDCVIGLIPIDAIFSPVRRVTYKVENSRVGAETEFDRLHLIIETDGSITPDLSLSLGAKILQEQLKVFIGFQDIEPIKEIEDSKLPFDPKLLIKVENLELSVRSQNCLKNENIIYIGDLVTKTEVRMLQTPNFGKKSLNEIKDLLVKMKLRFGKDAQGWPPENVEDVAKK